MLTTDIDNDGIAIVTIDRSDRPVNLMDWTFMAALQKEFSALASNADVSSIILTSAKSDFITGADLSMFQSFIGEGATLKIAAEKIKALSDPIREIELCGKPVIAAAPGTALGGGLEVMLGCHYRIAAKNERARYGVPEVTLGLFPAAGGTQRLPRIIGVAKSIPLILEGTRLTPQDALSIGLIDELVEPAELISAAKTALKEQRVNARAPWDEKRYKIAELKGNLNTLLDGFIFANSQAHSKTRGNYPAVKAALSSIFEGIHLPIDKALKIEQHYFANLVQGNETQALIRTTFFARQNLAKQPKIEPHIEAAYLSILEKAYSKEAARLVETGLSPAFVQNAALAVGMAKGPFAMDGLRQQKQPKNEIDRSALKPTGRHMLNAIAIAAAEAVQEKQIEDLDRADILAIDGMGFPSYAGGPLKMIDLAGPDQFVKECENIGLPVPNIVQALAAENKKFHQDQI